MVVMVTAGDDCICGCGGVTAGGSSKAPAERGGGVVEGGAAGGFVLGAGNGDESMANTC